MKQLLNEKTERFGQYCILVSISINLFRLNIDFLF